MAGLPCIGGADMGPLAYIGGYGCGSGPGLLQFPVAGSQRRNALEALILHSDVSSEAHAVSVGSVLSGLASMSSVLSVSASAWEGLIDWYDMAVT